MFEHSPQQLSPSQLRRKVLAEGTQPFPGSFNAENRVGNDHLLEGRTEHLLDSGRSEVTERSAVQESPNSNRANAASNVIKSAMESGSDSEAA